MCGIVGAVAQNNVVPILLDALTRLEYRGYDSAGIAVIADQEIRRARVVGRVEKIRGRAEAMHIAGGVGIGHTRWATHGGVTEANAHPHVSRGEIAVVHNGIIENHESLRERLTQLGYAFESQTDTEVIAHLIHHYFATTNNLFAATRKAMADFSGAYAIAVVSKRAPDQVVCARMGCPLLIGVGEGEYFLASDVSALLSATRKVIYLEDGDVAELVGTGLIITDLRGNQVDRQIHVSDLSLSSLELGPYSHFMQKEIHEQPVAIANCLDPVMRAGAFDPALFGHDAAAAFRDIDSVLILAAGTSYYAGLTAQHWLEGFAKLPTRVEIASEYRYRNTVANPRQLVVTISQSGETLDTMEALKHAGTLGHGHTLAICNVPESAIPRASRLVFYTHAGPEIGVASTKAFTTQLIALFTLAATLAKQRGILDESQERHALEALRQTARGAQHALNLDAQIHDWAQALFQKTSALFLGRGVHFPIALEGALKLKEISYIHAEAYPAGELKHGPLALVDEHMPIVALVPNNPLLEKVKSNLQEVRARGGQVYALADGDTALTEGDGLRVIYTPRHARLLSPIIHTIPLQLLAYHVALLKGNDVDKPRNLAKAVTVE